MSFANKVLLTNYIEQNVAGKKVSLTISLKQTVAANKVLLNNYLEQNVAANEVSPTNNLEQNVTANKVLLKNKCEQNALLCISVQHNSFNLKHLCLNLFKFVLFILNTSYEQKMWWKIVFTFKKTYNVGCGVKKW